MLTIMPSESTNWMIGPRQNLVWQLIARKILSRDLERSALKGPGKRKETRPFLFYDRSLTICNDRSKHMSHIQDLPMEGRLSEGSGSETSSDRLETETVPPKVG